MFDICNMSVCRREQRKIVTAFLLVPAVVVTYLWTEPNAFARIAQRPYSFEHHLLFQICRCIHELKHVRK